MREQIGAIFRRLSCSVALRLGELTTEVPLGLLPGRRFMRQDPRDLPPPVSVWLLHTVAKVSAGLEVLR